LQKQSGVLSGSALEGRKEALAKKQRDAQKTFQDTQEELAKVNDREIRKVREEIKKVVDEVADDRGYSFVFERDRQSVVFASDRLDITVEVIQRLDKKKVDL
jgi:Skp family chaperone for outer membrane proteins